VENGQPVAPSPKMPHKHRLQAARQKQRAPEPKRSSQNKHFYVGLICQAFSLFSSYLFSRFPKQLKEYIPYWLAGSFKQ